MPVQIRPETPSDASQIHTFTCAAFPSPLEANIVTALRNDSSLTLSLVALDETSPSTAEPQIIGHVAFSPVTITPSPTAGGKWVGLGPVSVLPSRQGQGIGGALIRAGLEMLRAQGRGGENDERDTVQGCVLLGSPKFYGRFGFESGRGLTLDGVPPECSQSLVLDETLGAECPVGKVEYHEVFNETLPEGVDGKKRIAK